MITQVGGHIRSDMSRDPRRKAQSVQFKNRNYVPYTGGAEDVYDVQEKKALKTSIAVVAGSALFMLTYFIISVLNPKNLKAVT